VPPLDYVGPAPNRYVGRAPNRMVRLIHPGLRVPLDVVGRRNESDPHPGFGDATRRKSIDLIAAAGRPERTPGRAARLVAELQDYQR